MAVLITRVTGQIETQQYGALQTITVAQRLVTDEWPL